MTNVFFIDDHPFFLEGVTQFLSKQAWINRVHTFTNPDDFLKERLTFESELPSSLFLLDINLNRFITGVDVCKELKLMYPTCKVIALSMHEEYRFIKGMMDAKADGYLFKTDAVEMILEAIQKVMSGGIFLSPAAIKTLDRTQANQKLIGDLNPKEKRVIELAFEGKTNKEIGQIMGVSYKTIEYYKYGIFIKFDVKNIKELEKLLRAENI